VKAFLSWCEGQGLELPAITPGMVGQYLVGLGGSAAKRNLHLSALRGFFDRLVNRHVVILNPAASVKGVKDQVIEGKTPEMAVEQARTLLAGKRPVEYVWKASRPVGMMVPGTVLHGPEASESSVARGNLGPSVISCPTGNRCGLRSESGAPRSGRSPAAAQSPSDSRARP